MKSIWSGAISFGLINIPVKIFSAVEDSSLSLDMLDNRDHSNIKYKRVNESTGREVAYENIVKGYKVNDSYVILEPEDFVAADTLKTKTIEILSFSDEHEIDSVYYEQPYYLEPDKSGVKAYSILLASMKATGKVGVTTFVLRNRESLAILKPYQNVIVLNRIRFQEEIRSASGLKLPTVSNAKTKELTMANKLIESLTEKFNISQYKDTYTAKLLKVIKAKSKGVKPKAPKLKLVHSKSTDLMSMLQESLSTRKRKKAS